MAGNQLESRDSLNLELRRGALVLAVLSQLRCEQYGYSLKKSLSDNGLRIDEGTLYPLMRRLESKGLLKSRWKVEEGRPRRYYRLNEEGEEALSALSSDWVELAQVMERLLK
jgi:DNA-binding PadR family transcriptional regulator